MNIKRAVLFFLLLIGIGICLRSKHAEPALVLVESRPSETATVQVSLTPLPPSTLVIPNTSVPPTPTLLPTLIHIEQGDFENEVILEIPKINTRAVIEVAKIIGTDQGLEFSQPEESPMWIPNWSRNIGQRGVALIYGHRQWGPIPRVFTDLDDLETGDQIIISTIDKVFTFEVVETTVIDPEDLWPTIEVQDNNAIKDDKSQLALLTCTPWGVDWQRLIVFAVLKEDLK